MFLDNRYKNKNIDIAVFFNFCSYECIKKNENGSKKVLNFGLCPLVLNLSKASNVPRSLNIISR